jgi:hypothetical protein
MQKRLTRSVTCEIRSKKPKQTNQEFNLFVFIPKDILRIIFNLLPFEDNRSCHSVCKAWDRLFCEFVTSLALLPGAKDFGCLTKFQLRSLDITRMGGFTKTILQEVSGFQLQSLIMDWRSPIPKTDLRFLTNLEHICINFSFNTMISKFENHLLSLTKLKSLEFSVLKVPKLAEPKKFNFEKVPQGLQNLQIHNIELSSSSFQSLKFLTKLTALGLGIVSTKRLTRLNIEFISTLRKLDIHVTDNQKCALVLPTQLERLKLNCPQTIKMVNQLPNLRSFTTTGYPLSLKFPSAITKLKMLNAAPRTVEAGLFCVFNDLPLTHFDNVPIIPELVLHFNRTHTK